MAPLTWDGIGDKVYQTGVDRGVLGLHNGTVVPWNGIISVDESPNNELKSFYQDGVKFLESLSPSDFEGKLKAYTYPDEFDSVNGVGSPAVGLSFHDQQPKSFDLSYRTLVGNDVEDTEYGYKIHFLYNILAKPNDIGFESANDSGFTPIEFEWDLTGTPVSLPGTRPTVHISVDSRTTDPEIMAALEAALYGTEDTDPRLLSLGEVAVFFGYVGGLVIVDHGDGTWSAIDEGSLFAPTFITMTDSTTFAIDGATVVIIDPDTYTIATTPSGGWS